MPTYDYECTKCGKKHQAQHGMNDEKPACPSCEGELKQVFLMAPAVNGTQGGSGLSDDACGAGDAPCSTGTCPFQS